MRIVNFGQVVDLENGQGMINQFTVLLDDGERVSIVTDADTLHQLVELATLVGVPQPEQTGHGYTVPPQEPIADNMEGFEEPPERYGLYGDEEDPGESYDAGDGLSREAEPVMGTVAEEYHTAPPEAVKSVQGLGDVGHKLGKKKKRGPIIDEDGFMVTPPAKTVSADEKGYPIVPGSGAPQEDQEEEQDEDGTQI